MSKQPWNPDPEIIKDAEELIKELGKFADEPLSLPLNADGSGVVVSPRKMLEEVKKGTPLGRKIYDIVVNGDILYYLG